ncbi:hypothetical protein AJ79_05987 [Helicocarpus griseus UAMH5409]|uniref:Uncharacterized protein n=1 Tax=Helicocarpus griseus UAMH5409 TaxID=1447875 RepID=A0A2B7XIQ4_9EURO|nr:hypothetical protein AJ79_05987 [Helicocarpus griseus UAMH5409]
MREMAASRRRVATDQTPGRSQTLVWDAYLSSVSRNQPQTTLYIISKLSRTPQNLTSLVRFSDPKVVVAAVFAVVVVEGGMAADRRRLKNWRERGEESVLWRRGEQFTSTRALDRERPRKSTTLQKGDSSTKDRKQIDAAKTVAN